MTNQFFDSWPEIHHTVGSTYPVLLQVLSDHAAADISAATSIELALVHVGRELPGVDYDPVQSPMYAPRTADAERKVDWADIEVLVGSTGSVRWNPEDDEVDTPGTYYGQFRVNWGSAEEPQYEYMPKKHDVWLWYLWPHL